MIGSLFNLLTRRPDLIIDHVSSYAALAQSEITATKRRMITRAVGAVVAIAFGTSAIVLAGVALMLATTVAPMSNAWTLYAGPAIALIIALIGGWIAANGGEEKTERGSLGEQFRRDLEALKSATGARS
jgi:hypothetical protein